ncbi:hypothetical protein UFOVP662_46 [uncultured Caudovirales phage]|uniref:Uncharacterized protein n=1 Tax=uncultured Caudovirales phage TaxID=2100421 RepID=A0A6J5QKP9_9CAUD|nr:hypothetical protein UFOVP662_46 [uncultured Caudovirales phage]CAB4181518.1 hypothetical protein UFOVP1067_46 [uncultured Caudovirales phage]
MGFNLLAFAGGAASAIEEKMDIAEKEAKTFAIASTKNMYEKYTKLIEENKTKAEEAAADMELIKSNYSSMADGKSFSAEQLAEIARSPNNRKFLVDAIKKGGINFGNLNPDQMVKIATSNNTPEVKREYIGQALALDTTLKTTLAEQRTKKQMGFFDQIGESAGRAAAEKAALALGTTTEQMKQALNEKPPVSTASFDFTGMRKEDTYDAMKNKAQVNFIKASKSNDPAALETAATDLAVFTALETTPPTEVSKWNEKKARLAAIIVKGGKEGKAAEAERDRMVDVEAKEALRKHIKPAGDGESKVPALGTLNSFVKDAGNRAVEMVHGKKLGSELSRTQLPDGTISLQYIGDNPEFAAQVDTTRRSAAMKALSLYPQDNRDVQAILKTYEQVAAAPVASPAPAAKPAIPAVPAKAAAPTATASPPASQSSNIGQERAIALEAIKKGAPEAAVRKRFKDTTGQEL